ncbi:MAG: hypothetical protein Q8S44_09445 [Flavobacteriaceae bacterium]|nr:hypothetical protein [Flavobacteriaceae bacterium]
MKLQRLLRKVEAIEAVLAVEIEDEEMVKYFIIKPIFQETEIAVAINQISLMNEKAVETEIAEVINLSSLAKEKVVMINLVSLVKEVAEVINLDF